LELVFVLLVLIAVVYGIIKDYNPQAVLALAGMALFTVAYWLGLHPILPADKSTGFALFDLFEVFKGSSPTGRPGSASPSWRWPALPPTCPISAPPRPGAGGGQPVAGIQSSYLMLAICYLVAVFVSCSSPPPPALACC
jgi:DcuC family C4-dicarboxylate transporter